MNNILERASRAKLILVPKGDDSTPCLLAFEKATGIKVPKFIDRKLETSRDGRTYLKVKGYDIPRFIAAGYGDLGLTGSDSCEEHLAAPDAGIMYEIFGPKMCRFVLLAPGEALEDVRQRLAGETLVMPVATSFPGLLRKLALSRNMKLTVADVAVSGSVEIMPRLLGVPLVADLVSSGSTAEANGLVEVETLLDIYPALVIKNDTKLGTRTKPAGSKKQNGQP